MTPGIPFMTTVLLVEDAVDLALVKELTEAMEGDVGVQSTLDEGRCFTVRFPVV